MNQEIRFNLSLEDIQVLMELKFWHCELHSTHTGVSQSTAEWHINYYLESSSPEVQRVYEELSQVQDRKRGFYPKDY